MNARALTLLAILAVGPGAAWGADALRRDYGDLLRLYARGDRAEAVAALGRWSDGDLSRQLRAVQGAARDAERCPTCPSPLDGLPLRAAVMLHADRDDADRPVSLGTEQPRPCPGKNAEIAGQYAALLVQREETRDFARRFLLGMAERCQWDFCLEAALRWSTEGLQRFPRDPELLLAAGSIHEETATIPSSAAILRMATISTGQRRGVRGAAAEREWWFGQARRFLADAVAADDGLILARVRLGRVLWRLGEGQASATSLDDAIRRAENTGHLYLAHLFLGRVHEDAGRLEEALREYSLAVELDPQCQAAAVALAHALRLAGDASRARRVLEESVAHAGRRTARDVYWDYLAGNAASAEERFAELRRETLE